MKLFTVGQQASHHIGDAACPMCWEQYPEPCRCGGLIHAAGGEDEDEEGSVQVVTVCDRCGRSEEDQAEP